MNDEYLDEEMKVMEDRARSLQFSPDVFKVPIGDICDRPCRTIDVGGTIGEAVRILQEHKVGSVVVLKEERIAGIVTERDLLMKVLGVMNDYANRPVSEIMTPDPIWLMKSDSIVYLMNQMHVGGFRHIPIVDEEQKPLHMVSLRRVLTYFFEMFPDEILNIPPEPYRGPVKRYGA